MSDLNISVLECAGCTAPLSEAIIKSGVHKCPYCGYVNIMPRAEQTSEVKHYLYNGDAELRDADFERAYSAYSRAAELDPTESKAFFGMALSSNRVKYIKDLPNKRWQAICYDVSAKSFSSDANLKRAIELATPEQREEYEARAKEIDYIRAKFLELKGSGLSYDTFICVKVTDANGKYTQDGVWAGKLYDSIKKTGITPFYSEREIGDRVGEDYEALILYALYTAKSFIIVCADESYLRTPWVQNEYSRYYSMLTDREKEIGSMMVAFEGTVIERIPGIPGKIQGVNLHSFDASQKIIEFVNKFSKPKQSVKKEIKLCVNCGSENDISVNFCSLCGSRDFAKDRAELIRLKDEAKRRAEAEAREQEQKARAEAEKKALMESEERAKRDAELKERQEEEKRAREEQQRALEELQRKLQETEQRVHKESELRAREESERKEREAQERARAQREAQQSTEPQPRGVAVKYCSKCGKANALSVKFCAECGNTSFSDSNEKYCSKCGEANPIATKFCASCGEKEFVSTRDEYRKIVEARIAQEKAEAERKARAEAEEKARIAREKAEAERKAKEEAERIAREKAEAERKAKEEAERKALEEEQKKADLVLRRNTKYSRILTAKIKCKVPVDSGTVSGDGFTATLNSNGTVSATGVMSSSVTDWKDIVSISAGENNTLFAVTKEGRVLSSGYNGPMSGYDAHVVYAIGNSRICAMLKEDGTVKINYHSGTNFGSQYQYLRANRWKDIIGIGISIGNIYAVNKKGEVYCTLGGVSDREGMGYYTSVFKSLDEVDSKIAEMNAKIAAEEKRRKAEEERIRLERDRMSKGLCRYCGSELKGVFKKSCVKCGKSKDY